MSELLNKPYKITLWEDKNKVIMNGGTVQNQYFEEVCIATIGSNTMDTPIRAFNPILIRDVNGSKTLTFQIYYRYWDDEDEEFKLNPFTNLLVNERKVKLYLSDEVSETNDGWSDFVIKQVQENSDSYTFTYTCKDLFINELGKTGYSVELDTELENNMGTITQLATSILEGSDWRVDTENSDILIQRNKEMLYSWVVPNGGISVINVLDPSEEPLTIAAGQVIFTFYSCKANKESPVQILYAPQASADNVDQAIANYYKVDEYGFIINATNYYYTPSDTNAFYDAVAPSDYFGQKIIRKQETHYIPQIGETCTVWEKDNTRYYCYKELEYASVAEIQNMLSNSCGFISTNAWVPDNTSSSAILSYDINQNYPNAITLHGDVYNTGFYDNRAILSPNGFVKGETYILAVKSTTNVIANGSIVKLKQYHDVNSDRTVLTFGALPNTITIPKELNGYQVFSATVGSTVTYATLMDTYGDIRFYLKRTGNADVTIIDCKIFKYRLDENDKMIVPDLEDVYYGVTPEVGDNPKEKGWYEKEDNIYILTDDTSVQEGKTYYTVEYNAIVHRRCYIFEEDALADLGALYTKEDVPLEEAVLEDEMTGYTPVWIDGCQKVTSITGSKSNRFNLIETLCEKFECWAKFVINHDNIGRTTYQYVPITEQQYVPSGRYYTKTGTAGPSSDDTLFTIYDGEEYQNGLYQKVYDKKVIFKEYIGDDNLVGFRYGINLKSIQRNLVSDQIASKVIVQANSNEFAPNGSCTIQQSVLNPTGENALYNFQYFINHGLLDEDALQSDLYGTDGGLGFFYKLHQYNESIQPLTNEKVEISSCLYNLNSRQTVYDSLLRQASEQKNDLESELRAAGYSPTGGGDAPDYIKSLRDKLASTTKTINYYTSIAQRNSTLVSSYTQKYNEIEVELAEIRDLKDKLVQDFENKYCRFIQEGTWNSNDYWDPELYYQAANMVLYTSSFPQVSYTINVLEISQVEGFEPYKFTIGDKTYVEDIEFFGYDSKGRPYKEEIIVSQIKSNLDDPSQNTITVRNYKTQFQDLFQRMAATSQSLQYNEGNYNRAASAINSDGTINSALMQNSLEANALIISNANNQSVTWDETGITISNFMNANEIVRLTSSGIALTKDGGRSWTTGITGDGVNADVITAGRIDTDRIRIFNKAMQQTFEWNSTGINAYMWDSSINGGVVDGNNNAVLGAVNYGKFVRFDKYGLYGYDSGDPSWNPDEISGGVAGINKVIRDSAFSLTWKGLHLNLSSGQGFSAISNPSGNPQNHGWYEYNSTNQNYELTSDTTVDPNKTYYENDDVVINVNDKFKVDGAGNIIATNGTFSGSINATETSTLGGWTLKTGQTEYPTTTKIIISGTGSTSTYYSYVTIGTTNYSSAYTLNRTWQSSESSFNIVAHAYSGNIYINGVKQSGTSVTYAVPRDAAEISIELSSNKWTYSTNYNKVKISLSKKQGGTQITSLYSGNRSSLNSSEPGVYIGTDGISAGDFNSTNTEERLKTLITSAGAFSCSGASINGTVGASSGNIGNWIIGADTLQNSVGNVLLSSEGIAGATLSSTSSDSIISLEGIFKVQAKNTVNNNPVYTNHYFGRENTSITTNYTQGVGLFSNYDTYTYGSMIMISSAGAKMIYKPNATGSTINGQVYVNSSGVGMAGTQIIISGKPTIDSTIYGSSLPSSPLDGQLFFVI